MKTKEIITLFERIKKHYNNFGYDDAKVEEWYRFLKDYAPQSVYDSFDTYLLQEHDQPPLITTIIRNASKTDEPGIEPKYTQCDLCGKLILVGEDWDKFETHHRRCEKIDFIDRQSKEIHNTGITKSVYYEMSDDELEKNYRAYMNNWIKTHQDIALNPERIIKKL